MREFIKECLITRVSNGAAAGTTELDSSLVDMQGYDAVTFIVSLSTVVDASVITATAKENTTNSTSGWTAVTGGAAGPVTASTSSNTDLVVDVVRPNKRYVGLALTRTAQNATVNAIYAVQYRAKQVPVTQTVSATALSTPEV